MLQSQTYSLFIKPSIFKIIKVLLTNLHHCHNFFVELEFDIALLFGVAVFDEFSSLLAETFGVAAVFVFILNLFRLAELKVEFKLDFGVDGLLRVPIVCLGYRWFFIYGFVFVSEVSVLVLGRDPNVVFSLFLSRWLCCSDDCFFISYILFERYLSLFYLGWVLTEFSVFTFYLVLTRGFVWVLPIDFDVVNFCYASELFLN